MQKSKIVALFRYYYCFGQNDRTKQWSHRGNNNSYLIWFRPVKRTTINEQKFRRLATNHLNEIQEKIMRRSEKRCAAYLSSCEL